MSSEKYKDIINIINGYVEHIKSLKQIDNNKYSNNDSQQISLLGVFGVPWRADIIMQNRLIEFKKVSILLSQSCTKLAILIVKKLSNEVIDSLLIEIKKYIELLNLGFLELQQCLLCDPLFNLIRQEAVCILIQIKEFLDYISNNNLDNNINISAGMISERSDSIQKLPLSNKAAYRRSILECISVTKDTVQEFEIYVQESNEQKNDEDTNKNDDDDDDDGMDFGEDVNYSATEIVTVNKCIALIKASLECMKVALSLMTCVGDNVTNSKSQRDTPSTSENTGDITVSSLEKPLLELQCDEWIVKVHRACKVLDSSVLSLGGDLYPPIIPEEINNLYKELYESIESTNTLLKEDTYQSMISTEVLNMLQNILSTTNSLPKNLV
jgi:hypothetical protein